MADIPVPAELDKTTNPMKCKSQGSRPLVVLGSFIHSISIDRLEIIGPNGLMVVDQRGKIVCLESSSDPWSKARLKDKLRQLLIVGDEEDLEQAIVLIKLRKGEFFLPGFVDTHTHAVQYHNIGVGQEHKLLDWLKHVTFVEEKRFEDELYARRMLGKVVKRLIRVGTTTCCYYGSIHLGAAKILAKTCYDAGQRAFIGKCNMDRNDAVEEYKEVSAEQSLQDSLELINFVRTECQTGHGQQSAQLVEKMDIDGLDSSSLSKGVECPSNNQLIEKLSTHSMIQPILTPRFAISCTNKLLGGLGKLMKADPHLLLQTHLSESLQEIEFTKNLFPECSSYAEIYDHFGLLTRRTILAHCVHLEPAEVELLVSRGCGLSHCPTSNFNLRSGICQVRKLLDSGVEKIGLGTDVSGGYGIGLVSVIRDASLAGKVVGFGMQEANGHEAGQMSIENLLYMATLGGARVCNLGDKTGNFEVGKEFDGLLIQTGAQSGALWEEGDSQPSQDAQDEWSKAYRPSAYVDGTNPNFFIDEQRQDADLAELLERFLFTGDDRNIGTVFVNSRVVGGSRPLDISL